MRLPIDAQFAEQSSGSIHKRLFKSAGVSVQGGCLETQLSSGFTTNHAKSEWPATITMSGVSSCVAWPGVLPKIARSLTAWPRIVKSFSADHGWTIPRSIPVRSDSYRPLTTLKTGAKTIRKCA